MGKPFNFGVTIPKAVGAAAPGAAGADSNTDQKFDPANVLGAWENYLSVIRNTVPYNINRAKASSSSLAKILG